MPHPPIPQDLADALKAARIHLFVGSGASKAASLLSWDELICEMKSILQAECTQYSAAQLTAFLSKADPLDIAELFRSTVGDHRYFQFLRQQFRKPTPISNLHRVLASLAIRTIYTTNYDKLLERAFREKNGDDPAVIVFANQLGYIADTECRIVKLHGDIDHPGTIILTRKDYAEYGARHHEFELALHHSVNDYSVLFVGFGLRDTNFRRIYSDARTLYDSGKRTAYAIMTDTNEIERELWLKDGLKILPLVSHAAVPGFLKKLKTLAS